MRFLCPSLRASKASVAIHKFKQTLSQKFKQSLKKPKNSANRPQAHHKNFQWIATNLHAYALQILAMTSSLSYCLICCHTEALAEVSTNLKHEFVLLKYGFFALNLKRALNFYGFFAFQRKLKMTKSLLYFQICHTKRKRSNLINALSILYQRPITTPSPLQKRHKISNFPRVA